MALRIEWRRVLPWLGAKGAPASPPARRSPAQPPAWTFRPDAFGPHTAAVRATLEEIAGIELLSCREPEDALLPWLEARLAAHLDALDSALQAPPIARVLRGAARDAVEPRAVRVVRTPAAAVAEWEAGWRDVRASAWCERLRRVGADAAVGDTLARGSLDAQRTLATRVADAVAYAVDEALARSPAWGRDIAPGWSGRRRAALPIECAAIRHVEWVALHGDDDARPSPWAPILAVWARGLWPLALPPATLLVYQPRWVPRGEHAPSGAPYRDGEVALDLGAERASAPVAPLQAQLRQAGTPYVDEAVGFGPLPADDRGAESPTCGWTRGALFGHLVKRGPLPPPDLPARE